MGDARVCAFIREVQSMPPDALTFEL